MAARSNLQADVAKRADKSKSKHAPKGAAKGSAAKGTTKGATNNKNARSGPKLPTFLANNKRNPRK